VLEAVLGLFREVGRPGKEIVEPGLADTFESRAAVLGAAMVDPYDFISSPKYLRRVVLCFERSGGLVDDFSSRAVSVHLDEGDLLLFKLAAFLALPLLGKPLYRIAACGREPVKINAGFLLERLAGRLVGRLGGPGQHLDMLKNDHRALPSGVFDQLVDSFWFRILRLTVGVGGVRGREVSLNFAQMRTCRAQGVWKGVGHSGGKLVSMPRGWVGFPDHLFL
jgi:hypothetical protein